MPSAADITQLAQARTDAVTYARYDQTGSISDCELFLVALRQLEILLPASTDRAGVESVRFELKRYADMRDEARRWLANKKRHASSGIRYLGTNCVGDQR